MKRTDSGTTTLTRRQAKFIAEARRRKANGSRKAQDRRRAQVTPPTDTKHQRSKSLARWERIGKAFLAIFGLAFTIAGLVLSNADSRLEIVGDKAPEIRGIANSGNSLTVLCVVYCTFSLGPAIFITSTYNP